jgi:hypothetical protein
MLSKRERALVHILVWTLAAVAFLLFGYSQLAGRREVSSSIALMEEQLARFNKKAVSASELAGRKEQLEAELAELRKRFYGKEEIDLYGFGASVRDLLVSSGLQINRYQTLELSEQTYLEFSVAGSAYGLVRFLQQVSVHPKHWSIPYLSINARGGDGSVQALFRIGYEQIDNTAD